MKPCPFCGCDEIEIKLYVHEYHAECQGCMASVCADDPLISKQGWNERKNIDSLNETEVEK